MGVMASFMVPFASAFQLGEKYKEVLNGPNILVDGLLYVAFGSFLICGVLVLKGLYDYYAATDGLSVTTFFMIHSGYVIAALSAVYVFAIAPLIFK